MRRETAPRPNTGVRRAGVLLFCACLLLAGSATAQTTGRIVGTVSDATGTLLSGVQIELSGPNLQGRRSVVTSDGGTYRFLSVPPGTYTLTASLPGLEDVQRTVTVGADATATIPLNMALRASAEITVFGETPMIDTTSTTTGSSYRSKVLERLPIGRNYADIVFSQPAAQADFGETTGRSLPISLYGSTSAENLYLIDGIDTTGVVKGTEGKDINNEFIEELDVKTGGYQAEYGRNTGGVINVITKSGGDEFHGGVFGYYNDTGMRAEPATGKPENYLTPAFSETGDAQAGNYIASKDVRQEYGVDLGGFFWKDRVWFFGAYDRIQINQRIQTLDPTNTDTFGQQFPNSYVQNKYAAKLTLTPLPGTTIVGTVLSDSQTQLGAITVPKSLDPLTYAGRIDTGGPDYGARLSQLFGSFGIFSFQYARHSERYATIPAGFDIPQVRDYTTDPNGVNFQTYGGFGQVFGPTSNNRSLRDVYGGSFTATLGDIELKVGGDYRRDATSGATYFSGGQRLRIRPCLQFGANICDLARAPFFTNPDGETTQVFYQHDLLVSGTSDDHTPLVADPFSGFTGRASGYLQGQWSVLPTLTLNVGIRYDTENFHGDDPLNGPFRFFTLSNQWAPRVGVAWDFIGDGSSKLYGSFGRFYYAIPTDLNIRVFTSNSALQAFNYDPNSTSQFDGPQCTFPGQAGCVPRNQLFQGGTAGGEPADGWTIPLDPNTGAVAGNGVLNGDPRVMASYQDEVTVGLEMALNSSLTVGLKGIYRSLGRTVEDRCDLNPNFAPFGTCVIFNPGGPGQGATGAYGTCNGSGNPTDPNAGACTDPGQGVAIGPARRLFRGIELLAREQFSNALWAQASFLYSSLIGNFSGAVHEATGQTDPTINADYDYAAFTDKAYGRLELDRPVQARIDAVYEMPFGLSAGAGFYVRSGRPTSQYGWYNGFYPSALYLSTRGTAGRLPTDYDMNLSAAYDLNVGPVTITPALYLFNVLNRQTANDVVQTFNPNAAFVTDPSSPFYGQAGVQPGTTDSCPATATAPCPDDPDYRKITQRIGPRLLRFALKVTF